MLARLCIIIFLFFSFTCAETIQQDKQEIKILEKYEGYSSHIQWFASLGVGGLYHSNLKSVFLDNYFAMGLIIPYSDRVSHYFSIDFDSVFLNDWYRKYVDTLGVSTSISNQILETIHYRSSGGYALNFSVNYNFGYSVFYTKGYRILSKVPRMPSNIVENLVGSFKSFQHILAADIESLDDVDGIGEVRARTIKQSLKRMQEQFVFDEFIGDVLN